MTTTDTSTSCNSENLVACRGGSRPMQPVRIHRSEFHVNLTPPSQVSIKTRKNNNMHILISKRVRVGPIVVLSINNYIDKNNDFKWGQF